MADSKVDTRRGSAATAGTADTAGTSGSTKTGRGWGRGWGQGRKLPKPKMGRFVRDWLFDILFLFSLGLLTLGLQFAPLALQRSFPLTYEDTEDVVYPEWAYSPRHRCIGWIAAIVVIIVLILFFLVSLLRTRSLVDFGHAVFGLFWAVTVAAFISTLVKIFVEGFAPYFLVVCNPAIVERRFNYSVNRWSKHGFQRVIATTQQCNARNASELKDALSSFPSSCAVIYFAGFGFLFLWLNAKFKIGADHRPSLWKWFVTLLPLLYATLDAGALVTLKANHWYDVVAGAILGFAVAVAAYRGVYASVWDWRHNHMPLHKNKPHNYGDAGTFDKSGPVMTRSGGWGPQKNRGPKSEDEASVV